MVKKTIITVVILLFIALDSSFSQNDFRVIKVNGTILLKEKGISLETGTVFTDKEDLVFRTEDATAAVINSRKGRLILSSSNHDLSDARSNSLPSMYNISSRGGNVLNNNNLSDLFSGKCVILNRLAIEVDEKSFPMDNSHFFFLRYVYKGEEINKKLAFSGDSLIIDKNTLFTIDGNPIPSADNTLIKLFYRKGTESVFISQFDLIFPDMKQLSREIQIILDEIKDKTYKMKFGEIDSYINELYGKVYMENLAGWLKNNFGVEPE
jgi:hypothetical protein